ncbi:hypothetical protein [uncultured Pseudodesulfovibrio sp.]|uniref:hypothetical protein n=1 Tax=uncultured Pseudodesulfovibrio sp. TaxID=2035858 RepID=UPI0029C81524|nr:hypothetical protein [uncultured Pseudodesulfovibrio sp.]
MNEKLKFSPDTPPAGEESITHSHLMNRRNAPAPVPHNLHQAHPARLLETAWKNMLSLRIARCPHENQS